ncbi:hypothetical protein [Viridibacillus sp. FSL H7-0596]|nr:hypothetical protein [Viridibacillus sp. FSL H7-0596]
MKALRHCGICEEKNTYKEFCWKCEQRSERFNRVLQKKLTAKQEDKL